MLQLSGETETDHYISVLQIHGIIFIPSTFFFFLPQSLYLPSLPSPQTHPKTTLKRDLGNTITSV